VPVHTFGIGSIFLLSCVSLYVTSVRYGVCDGSVLGSKRIFQKMSLPLKNARCMPASRAAVTLALSAPDQYSSWPTASITL
jgi:hypothetical protein